MNATGIVRKLDPLGRIVLPAELRKSLDLNVGAPLEIFVDGNKILLKKYEPVCVFCGEARDVSSYKGKLICNVCIDELRS
ncbi:MAG TPA: AbrB/MazE/SpoVT family DNA-binding domain-containing protein [Clostridiales bacterium]|nr:AbrB/MazE/SpoVT family DNA-binding domain-containing protein [Clostridiales bacterium]